MRGKTRRKRPSRKKRITVVDLPSLERQIQAFPLPEGMFWAHDSQLLKYQSSSYVTACVAFLCKLAPERNGVYYAPLLVGWRKRPQGRPANLDERVRRHVADFQAALFRGTAPFTEDGGVLDINAKVPA